LDSGGWEKQPYEYFHPDSRKEVIDWLKALDEELSRGEFRFEPYTPDRWRE
jgi:hypothetical protein